MGKVSITDHLFLITARDPKRFPYSNSLLIDDEVKGLVDTGLDSAQLKKLANENKIDILINSHYHIDHVRGNWMFPNASLYAPTQDALAISSYDKFLEMTGFNKNKKLVKFFEKNRPELFGVREKIRIKVRFKDNYEFDFGETNLRVIHSPGHTPGHSCFYEPRSKILYSTDVDLTSFGPWYGNASSDIEDFINSIERLHHLRPRVVMTSHSGPFEGQDRIDLLFDKYIDVIYKRDEKILDLLKKERTLDDLVGRGIIYPKPKQPMEMFHFFEEVMLQKHLDRLVEMGDVSRVDKDKYKAEP
ncbi:MAG: MBL fold metallo-hydrolase [Candidatus Atabeyarchaeum deiterrae]